jgi:acyl carrier protein
MNNNLLQQVYSIVSDLFLVPVEDLRPESSPETIESWDSMQHLNLVLDLESTFDIKFSPKEVEDMKSIASVVAIIERKQASSVHI